MNQKFASVNQNENHSFKKLNQKINAINFKKVSPKLFLSSQEKYDAISFIYAKEIESTSKFLSSTNPLYFFSKEKFSKYFEDFKEKFEKINININFYKTNSLDEIIIKTSNLNCNIALIDILNDENDVHFMSEFLDLQNIFAINFSNCNTVLSNKMSINVDFKKNILKSLSTQEKLKIFLDCVYLGLQAKRTMNLKSKIQNKNF